MGMSIPSVCWILLASVLSLSSFGLYGCFWIVAAVFAFIVGYALLDAVSVVVNKYSGEYTMRHYIASLIITYNINKVMTTTNRFTVLFSFKAATLKCCL